MKFMPRFGSAIFALLIGSVLSPFGSAEAEDGDRFFTFGSGGVRGMYFPIVSEICKSVNEHALAHGYRCGIVATNGSVENYEGVRDGTLAFAIVQSNVVVAHEDPSAELVTLSALHAEPLHVAVRADSKIATLRDIARHSANLGAPKSGTQQIARTLLEAAGIELAPEQQFQLAPSEQSKHLCDGSVDALFWASGLGNSSMEEAHRRCPVRLLEIPSDIVREVTALMPGLAPMTIPAGTYAGQDEPVETLGPVARVVTRVDTETELVTLIAAAIAGQYGDVRRKLPALFDLSDADLARLFPGEMPHPHAITPANAGSRE